MISYEGLFFESDQQEIINLCEEKHLENINDMIHCTFKYHPSKDEVFNDIVGKSFEIMLIGYGNDGKNSGFEVALPEELKKYYINYDEFGKLKVPHITVSLADGAQGENTKNLNFKKLENPVKMIGKFGFWIKNDFKEYVSFEITEK